ncbi:MAG TPA: cytidylate kinase family protein [Candidatus Paceibacterota bacterium]|jgi:cytidylate kinase|nr:cytidylate kinase family protein [Candidatus Paceibacterota bacterium]
MEKKHIITIAGKLGSGKSSTAKKIAETLGYEHASTGDFMRKMAEDRGISLGELGKIAENDPSVDIAIDDYCRKIGNRNNIVLDSRLGFHFIPQSFKVFLELDPMIAAKRILEDAKVNPLRHKETLKDFSNIEEIAKSITERLQSERKRYKELYNIKDHTDPKNFNLVINTAAMPLNKVASKIIEEYNKWLNIK